MVTEVIPEKICEIIRWEIVLRKKVNRQLLLRLNERPSDMDPVSSIAGVPPKDGEAGEESRGYIIRQKYLKKVRLTSVVVLRGCMFPFS